MASRGGQALGGAASGAAAGSALGPWGTAAGAVIGGLSGWFGGGGPSDADVAAQEAQMRERENATQLARAAAEGTAPSAAQSLLNMNVARNNELALGQAKGMAGANPALAAVMASNASAQNSQMAAAQGAALRAQEMADARAQYLAATGVNVSQGQTRDAAGTAQNNIIGAYNDNMINSLMNGGIKAAGMFAGAQQPGKPAVTAAPAAKPKPQTTDWGY